jgi:superfamily I DNA/RNA helicase
MGPRQEIRIESINRLHVQSGVRDVQEPQIRRHVLENGHLVALGIPHLLVYTENLSEGFYGVNFCAYYAAADILDMFPNCVDYLRFHYKALFVDEAQDLNSYQFGFLSKFVTKCEFPCCFAGDKNQSIYEFRGARPGLFIDLKNKGFKEYQLTYSLRCEPSILKFAHLVVGENWKSPVGSINVYINNQKEMARSACGKSSHLFLTETNDQAKAFFSHYQKSIPGLQLATKISLSDQTFSDQYLQLIEEILFFYFNFTNQDSSFVYLSEDFLAFLSNAFDEKTISSHRREILDTGTDPYGYLGKLFKILSIPTTQSIIKELEDQLSNQAVICAYKKGENTNRVMTIHSAKGLEADEVVVMLVDRGFDINQETKNKWFVAFSRARNKLFVSIKEKGGAVIQPYLLSVYSKLAN